MADSALIDEELERVYRLYGERARRFRRGLYVLIVGSLVFLVLVVAPFLTFRDQVAGMQELEANLTVELQQARDLVNETRADLEEMREILEAVYRFAQTHRELELYLTMEREAAEHALVLEDLRRSLENWNEDRLAPWLRGEAKQPPEEVIASNRRLYGLDQRPCYWESGNAHVACRVCDDFTREHNQVALRISRLDAVEEAARNEAVEDLGTLVERACGWLTRGEEHWKREATLPTVFFGHIRGWLSLDLGAYEERIDAVHATLRQSLPERELEVKRLERQRELASERADVLQEQLERIASFDRLGTPFGDLPVGLGQLVLLFPVAVTIGFLIVASGYTGTVDLQRAFVRLCRKRDPSGDVMDEHHIGAIIPLWLESSESLGVRAVRWVILLIPLGLVLINLTLIVTTEALTAQLPDDSAISPAVYIVLYAASLVLLAGTLWHIWHSGGEPRTAQSEADSSKETAETE